ncbi:MAG: type VI secretion system amidase effector protein Tae4 [Candidatus Accumulibacter sp.]|jgi:hypothetical protein|nr:type VI secretion system amidase effector protein Tae4 [Accumulibacter sp.]
MAKPSFSTLKANHYSSNENSGDFKSGADVYSDDVDKLVAENGDYQNTCAVRMSLALLKSNVFFGTPVSRLKIKEGAYKGRFVAAGAKTLADALSKPTVLGQPLSGKKAEEVMKTKRGVVLFHGIPGYDGGRHIDLIEAGGLCHSRCFSYPSPRETWCWPLD